MADIQDNREILVDWLRDAHAMEQQAEKMLNSFCERLEHYPELEGELANQLNMTRNQQDILQRCIDQLGEKPSAVKDAGARLMGWSQTFSGVMMSDEVVKGTMSIYVFKQMEIASYTILAAAAKQMRQTEVETISEQLLSQEKVMGQWLYDHLPRVTQAFLTRSAGADTTAKR